MANRRKDITNFIIDNIKLIDGNSSPLGFYMFIVNLFNNVIRGFKFLDEINDFPYITVTPGLEVWNYNSQGLVETSLPLNLRIYVKEENPQSALEDLFQDIEHIIYNLPDRPDLGIQDITIDSSSTDEGLIEPYGMGEILLIIRYILER